MPVGKLIMIDHPLPQLPLQPKEGRKIELTQVIENFGLPYQLACTVKQITRTKRNTSALNNIQKALGHLDREIKRHRKVVNPCIPVLSKKPLLTIVEVLEDWNLTPNLRKALFHILHSCQLPPPGLERGLFPGKGSIRLSLKSKDFFYHTLPLIKARRFLNLAIAELRTTQHEKENHS
jgi:hypothetical protein